MRLFRPEFCLGVAVLLSFLSLTVLLLTSAPSSGREASWTSGPGRFKAPVLEAEGSAVSPVLLALDSRLDAMERRIQELGRNTPAGQAFPYPYMPQMGAGLSVSQGQLDGLVQQMTDAFRHTQAPAPPPRMQDLWGGWSEPTTTTPEWQGQLKDLKEAVERLSHQTDDRFSSLMRPRTGAKGVLATAEGHACRSPPCSRDLDSCKVNGNCCADLMFEMLVDFSRFLTRQNVTFMVSEGTLLGAVRDQDIIPYTADLDIFVPREGWERAMLINEEPLASKSYHMMVDPDQPHCARLCAVWQGFPVNRAPFDQHFQWDTEKVGNDLAYFMDIYDEEMDFAQATKHLIYPASTVMIRNISFPAPREQEIYVEARYGPNWRVPDHQARELAEKYPTLEEAKVWSTNMLLLHAAQRDIQMGYRLLERATVDYKTGDIVIRSGDRPRQLAKKLVLEDFQTSDGHVTGGKITIYPPEHDEFQIVDYVLYWAKEEVSTWSDEITLKRIDSGMDTLEDANKEREEESGGSEWGYRPARPLGRIWRCKNVEDPFKRCSQRGIPLQVTIPHEIKVPEDATHLAAASENEAGENPALTTVRLSGEEPETEGDPFSRKVIFGLLQGFEAERCKAGGHTLEKEVWESIVAKMVMKTNKAMKEALAMLNDWIGPPVLAVLEDCKAAGTKQRFAAALQHMTTATMSYHPSEALTLDDVSIFAYVNGAISSFRRDSFATFGRDLGGMLKELVPSEAITTELQEEAPRPSGLKLRPVE